MKRSLPILFLFAFVQIGQALTLSQLRTEIRRNMRDTSSNSDDQRYSDAVLLDFVNEAQREINNVSGLSEKTTEYALTRGTTYYSLPSDLIAVLQVQFKRAGASFYELDETSRDKLAKDNPGWETNSGTPLEYYTSLSTYSAPGSTSPLRISYIPIPNSASSTGTVRIVYWNQVDDLASDADVPFNNLRHLYPYHMTIVYHASMRLKAIEGRPDEAKFYSDLYVAAVKILMDKNRTLPNYKPGFPVGGGR